MSVGTAFHPRTAALNTTMSWGEWSGYFAAAVYAASEGLSVVVLAHLSQQCNDPAHARLTVSSHLRKHGFRGDVLVALQDEPLPAISLAGTVPADQTELELW